MPVAPAAPIVRPRYQRQGQFGCWLVMVLMVITLVGGPWAYFATHPDDWRSLLRKLFGVKPPSKELTDDEKAAWLKVRRREKKPSYQVMAYFHGTKDWKYYEGENRWDSGWSDYRWHSFHDEEETTGIIAAERKAKKWIDEPAIKTVVVVDLFSEDQPRVIKWFFNDGRERRVSTSCPFPDLDESLQWHLLHTQRAAGR